MRIIYFGTSTFGATVLRTLLEKKIVPVAVVTQPDRPAGRGQELGTSPVKRLAQMHNLPILQPKKLDASALMELRALQPTCFVVAAYGAFLPQSFLSLPPRGALNVHPSLLPLYRGPSPIQSAILSGDAETGVSIMLLDRDMDHGPIFTQQRIAIAKDVTADTLSDQLAVLGGTLLADILPRWHTDAIRPVEQEHTKATITKLLTKDDGHLDWTRDASFLARHIRAMAPWPGSWTMFGSKRLRITAALPLANTHDAAHGTVLPLSAEGLLPVACNQSTLAIFSLQMEGKKEMSAAEFLRGHSNIIGAVLS